jgi:hypothetical protein
MAANKRRALALCLIILNISYKQVVFCPTASCAVEGFQNRTYDTYAWKVSRKIPDFLKFNFFKAALSRKMLFLMKFLLSCHTGKRQLPPR